MECLNECTFNNILRLLDFEVTYLKTLSKYQVQDFQNPIIPVKRHKSKSWSIEHNIFLTVSKRLLKIVEDRF